MVILNSDDHVLVGVVGPFFGIREPDVATDVVVELIGADVEEAAFLNGLLDGSHALDSSHVLDGSHAPDGGAVVQVYGNSLKPTLKPTFRPGTRLALKEPVSGLGGGVLDLFRNSRGGLIYRRVEWRGADTVALVPKNDRASEIVLRWPEDEGEWEALARVDRVLKPL